MQAPYEYKRLWLMRHGETFPPSRDALAPREEDLPLTPVGIEQIQRVAAQLQSHRFDAIVSSGMTRTVQTAQHLADVLRMPVQQETDLREMPLPVKPDATLRDVSLAYIAICRQLETQPPDDVMLPGPISVGALCQRYLNAIHRILQPPHVEQALVVAHGGVNRFLLCAFLGLPYAKITRFEQDNGCVNLIDFTKRGRPYVRLINHTAYDPWKEGSPFQSPTS